MKEKINEMIEMQKKLDKAIYKEHNTQFDEEKCIIAIIDEIGELTHELKGNWCWWKKTQKPVDRQRVLEELVDIFHFAMSYSYNTNKGYEFVEEQYNYLNDIRSNEYSYLICNLVDYRCKYVILENLMVLTDSLGFTIDDVYGEYLKKNKENYERLANNY